ncbi:MAG: hypothetical protein RR764_09940 [Oscillospiraceae bacterium]|uniref:hypothetical protein n=1 Tax=Chryseobacterium sp. TaxID=1871047 RepID=UPI002FC5A742
MIVGLVGEVIPPTMMQNIITSMGDAFTLVGTIITKVVGNPVLLFCLAAGLIPVGISIFRNLRHSVN